MCCLKPFITWFVLVICVFGRSLSQKPSNVCVPFPAKMGLEKLCGYDETANYDYLSHLDSAIRAVKTVSRIMGSCSAYANLIVCSVYIPRCVSNIDGPYLPCRRVCDEFEDKCGDKIINLGLEAVFGVCQLLPKKDNPWYSSYLDRCFEPPGFSTSLPDDGASHSLKCHPLVVRKCQNTGYNYTTLSTENQELRRRYIDQELNKETNDSISCTLPRKRFLCTEYFPACINKTMAMYCRKNCEEFFNSKCTPPFNHQKDICMEYPKGNSAVGICKRTQWPRTENWFAARQVYSTHPVALSSKPLTYQTASPPTTSDTGIDGKAISSASLAFPHWTLGIGVGTVAFLTFRRLS